MRSQCFKAMLCDNFHINLFISPIQIKREFTFIKKMLNSFDNDSRLVRKRKKAFSYVVYVYAYMQN